MNADSTGAVAAWLARRVLGGAAVLAVSSGLLALALQGIPGGSGQAPGAWWLQFWRGVLAGDLGPSYRGLPVLDLVSRGARTTLPMLGVALLGSLLAAGALAALPGRLGRGARALAGGLSLIPGFLLAYLLLVLMGVPPHGPARFVAGAFVLGLADGTLAELTGVLRRHLDALADRGFVHSARIRGLPMLLQIAPHLALPVAQAVASRASFLLGGVLVLEIQGLGLIGYHAAVEPDLTLLVAIAVLITACVAAVQLAVDGLRVLVDPRVRKERRRLRRVGPT